MAVGRLNLDRTGRDGREARAIKGEDVSVDYKYVDATSAAYERVEGDKGVVRLVDREVMCWRRTDDFFGKWHAEFVAQHGGQISVANGGNAKMFPATISYHQRSQTNATKRKLSPLGHPADQGRFMHRLSDILYIDLLRPDMLVGK